MNANPVKKNTQSIPTLNISGAVRQRFLINGDPNKVLEINTTDLGVIERIRKYFPKLQELEQKFSEIKIEQVESEDEDTIDFEKMKEFSDKLSECDKDMRKYLDLIFDANVSEVCDCGGTMYDPVNGQLRYASIISDISGVYGEDFTKELNKMNKKRETNTSKYTKKK